MLFQQMYIYFVHETMWRDISIWKLFENLRYKSNLPFLKLTLIIQLLDLLEGLADFIAWNKFIGICYAFGNR